MLRLANPIAAKIETGVLSQGPLANYLPQYLATLINLLTNQVIIPALIDLETAFEVIETTSRRYISVMRKNFFFMVFNTIILPLTGFITIREFIDKTFVSFIADQSKFFSFLS